MLPQSFPLTELLTLSLFLRVQTPLSRYRSFLMTPLSHAATRPLGRGGKASAPLHFPKNQPPSPTPTAQSFSTNSPAVTTCRLGQGRQRVTFS